MFCCPHAGPWILSPKRPIPDYQQGEVGENNGPLFRKVCVFGVSRAVGSASPKPHPSKPHSCNMPPVKTEVALQFSESCAAEVALQHLLFCSADAIFTKSCAATNEKLRCHIEKLRCRKVALSCRFPADFKPPRLGTHV